MKNSIKSIPAVLFAAPKSGSGKTMVTCGFLELVKRRAYKPVSFKVGPDYIDPMFHKVVQEIPGRNLDSFFMDGDSIRTAFKSEFLGDKNLAVIEGVMGYYDGIGGTSELASAYDIARILGIGTVLVVDVHGMAMSAAALIKGIAEFREDSRISGVILNRCTKMLYMTLKPVIEKETGIKLYGYIPHNDEISFPSRYLGLTLPDEIDGIRDKISRIADMMEESVDIDGILEDAVRIETENTGSTLENLDSALAEICDSEADDKRFEGKMTVHKPVLAIARDEAFCFCYQENIEFLRERGFEIQYFSPLRDKEVPEEACGIVLYGGYPEQYAKKLSENTEMLEALRNARKQGIGIMAECGGFLYLHTELQGSDGSYYKMADIVKGKAYKTEKLSRFGYVMICEEDKVLIRGHEFHYYDSENNGSELLAVKPSVAGGEIVKGKRSWSCIHREPGFLAGFPHMYYRSGEAFIDEWLESCRTKNR